MAYEKQHFADNATILTAAHLQHIENGIADCAPAGYGLGELPHSSLDINKETLPSYFRVISSTANTSELQTYGAGHVRVYDSSRIVQNVFRVTNGCELVRYTNDSGATWIEEWVNPPMELGTEYRTTERLKGKAVYVYLADCGTLPNTTSKSVSTAIPSSANVVSVSGIAVQSGGTSEMMPCISYNGSVTCSFFVTSSKNISINTFTDMSAYTGYITVKYTKD